MILSRGSTVMMVLRLLVRVGLELCLDELDGSWYFSLSKQNLFLIEYKHVGL